MFSSSAARIPQGQRLLFILFFALWSVPTRTSATIQIVKKIFVKSISRLHAFNTRKKIYYYCCQKERSVGNYLSSTLPLLVGYSLSLFFWSGLKCLTRNVVAVTLPGFWLHLQSLPCLLKKIWAKVFCLRALLVQRKHDEVHSCSAVIQVRSPLNFRILKAFFFLEKRIYSLQLSKQKEKMNADSLYWR